MILCITGISCSGKSTLLDNLLEMKPLIESLTGKKVVIHKEYIRDYVKRNHGDVDLDEILQEPESAIKFHIDITDYMVTVFNSMLSGSNEVIHICDRGPMDLFVYTTLNYSRANDDIIEKYKSEYVRVSSLQRTLTSCVDGIYMTLPDHGTLASARNDGFRASSYNPLRAMESELFNSVMGFNPKVIKLPSQSDLRVNTIIKHLVDNFSSTKRI